VTTLEEPPVASIHTIWQKLRFATYLLCILIKQHTGIGTGTLDHSILSLQASSQETHPTRNFYISLGFLSHDASDNGLLMTSGEFQEQVEQFPKVWITPENCEMTLFRLVKGRIKLMAVFDLSRSELESDPPIWKTYTYCKFPYECDSMEKIESFAKELPILRSLSLSSLPLTPRPFVCKPSPSSMSGLIVGDRRVQMTSSSWLKTDQIQLLCAFLMRDIDGNTGLLHVLSPSITKNIHDLHDVMPVMMEKKENAPKKAQRTYETNLDVIFKYIESRLDILEHRFLVFLCNTNSNHWVAVVVINPFIVIAVNKKTGAVYDSDLCNDDELMAGWCVMNSNPSAGNVQDSGFQGTAFTKNKASFGVRIFLNICASYIKFRKDKNSPLAIIRMRWVPPISHGLTCTHPVSLHRITDLTVVWLLLPTLWLSSNISRMSCSPSQL
jgi:hypothetical protein